MSEKMDLTQHPRLKLVGGLAAVVPMLVAIATNFHTHGVVFYAGILIAALAPFIVNGWARDRSPFFYLGAYGGLVGLTMIQAGTGGVASGYTVLAVMALIWFGVQGTPKELAIALALLVVCAYGPMLVFGAPAYPVSWGHATIFVLMSAGVAGALHQTSKDLRALQDRLEREAVIDVLTGLHNRRGWELGSALAFGAAKASRDAVTVVAIDLDGLKALNDATGHSAGDRLLRETGHRIAAAFRSHDVVARLGGDEFIVLLPGVGLETAVAVAGRLEAATPREGSFSAGVATWDGVESFGELVRRADTALYAAKAAGGGRIERAHSTRPPAIVAAG